MSSDTSFSKPALRAKYGATLLGSLVGVFLSGIVAMQVYLYARVYMKDRMRIKFMVVLIWAMDLLHTCLICVASWMDLIERFGEWEHLDWITWSVGASVAVTALVTFFVHCFFIHRIYVISHSNRYLTFPLGVVALFRLVAALVSTSEMITLASYSGFVRDYGYVFTMGLSSAVALDIAITAAMCYYLERNKSQFSTMNSIIDALILYTVETGMITCVTTIASLACWLAMPNNLIFLGLHFTIPKLYANSFMAILNSRAGLGASRSNLASGTDRIQPLMLSNFGKESASATRSKGVEINVETTIVRDVFPVEHRSSRLQRLTSDENIGRFQDVKNGNGAFEQIAIAS